MASNNIIEGTGGNQFSPHSKLTRAEFVTMLVRGLGLTGYQGASFSDVPNGAWYHEGVSIASGLGIIQGKGNGQFAPMDNISRQEIMTVLKRTADTLGLSFEGHEVTPVQSNDYDDVSTWAQEYVLAMKAVGVLDNDGNSIGAKDSPNRDETASYIYKFLVNSNQIY